MGLRFALRRSSDVRLRVRRALFGELGSFAGRLFGLAGLPSRSAPVPSRSLLSSSLALRRLPRAAPRSDLGRVPPRARSGRLHARNWPGGCSVPRSPVLSALRLPSPSTFSPGLPSVSCPPLALRARCRWLPPWPPAVSAVELDAYRPKSICLSSFGGLVSGSLHSRMSFTCLRLDRLRFWLVVDWFRAFPSAFTAGTLRPHSVGRSLLDFRRESSRQLLAAVRRAFGRSR